ncbi:MAG: hypothetical protein FJW14_06835 [Acidimicrobiia bacterium]|nr:hypothetical protein [Acidimicrobiia bacterium]
MPAPVSDVDGLFQLPLDEFTAARNALAAQLKKAGRGEDADRIKGLPKPSVPAWTVNQLYWKHRKPFERLLAAGEKFRNAQAAQLAGKKGDLREPLDARRNALNELTKLGGTVLKSGGHNPGPDMMRRVMTTLEALATYGTHPDAPPAGRLTDDVDPPGFEAVAALIPHAGRGLRGTQPTRVLTFQQRESKKKAKLTPEELEKQREEERKVRVAAAKAAVQEAERTLRTAKAAAERAEAALKKAAARAKEAEKAKAELEKRWEKLVADAEETRQEARRVASEAEDAAQEVEDAERALDKARKDLDALDL